MQRGLVLINYTEGDAASGLPSWFPSEPHPVQSFSIEPPFDTSNFDYSLYLEDLTSVRQKWTDDRAFLPAAVIYGLTFFFGVLGNSLVISALLCDPKSRSVTSSFLVSLSVADLIFLVICVPYEIVAKQSSGWVTGTAMCKLGGFVEMLSAAASVLNLTAVSIERYVVIVHPIKSRFWCSLERTQKTIALVWVVAVLLSSPLLHLMDTTTALYYNQSDYVQLLTCVDGNTATNIERIVFSWYQLIVMFICPICVMVYCYAFVIHVLWLSTKELDRLTHDTDSSSCRIECIDGKQRLTQSREQLKGVTLNKVSNAGRTSDAKDARKQVIKMFLAIIGVFFICCGPKWVMNIMKRHNLRILHTDAAFNIMLMIHLLPYVQSCINPFIYCFMSNNFRRSVRNMCCWRRRSGSHVTRSQIEERRLVAINLQTTKTIREVSLVSRSEKSSPPPTLAPWRRPTVDRNTNVSLLSDC